MDDTEFNTRLVKARKFVAAKRSILETEARNDAALHAIMEEQRRKLIEALGGEEAGWRGFYSSAELLAYLRDTDPAYSDVTTLAGLARKLDVTLDVDPFELARARLLEEHEWSTLGDALAKERDSFKAEQLREWEERANRSLTERKK